MTLQEFIKRILKCGILICFLIFMYCGVNKAGKYVNAEKADKIAERTGVFYLGVGPNASISEFGKEIDIGKEESDPKVSIAMVGDMLMHESVLKCGKKNGIYNYDGLFEHVADHVRQTDLAIVNQETILGGTDLGLSGYPEFNSPTELGDSEIKAGFNIILHATNHVYDKGKKGILNTIHFWENQYPGIPYLGINKNREHKDNFLCCYEKNGIRIAILNYTFGTNGERVSEENSYLINYLDENRVVRDLKRAREKTDFLIVCPHWGTEYKLAPNNYQEHWTRIFLKNGVDLVLGAHPHVIQPIQWVTDGKDKKMLVYYSMGNFVNGTTRSGSDVLQRIIGGMAEVTIKRDAQGKIKITDYGVRPLICHFDEQGNYTTYFLREYTEDLLKKNEYRKRIPDLSMAKCWNYVHRVWGKIRCE